MVVTTQSQKSPAVGQELPKSTKGSSKHKLVNVDDMTESCASELLLPLATNIMEKGKLAMAKMEEAYAIASPKVEPVVKFVSEQHAKHPEVVRLVVSFVALLYGGCFFKLAVLYATFNLAGTQQFFKDVMAAYKGTGANVMEKALDTLRKSDPTDFMKLGGRAAWQFCAYAAVLNSGIATAAVLAIFVEEKGAFLRPLMIAKVKPMVDTEEMQRWVPFAVTVASKKVLFLLAWLTPRSVASLLFAYEGGLAIAGYVSQHLNEEPLTEMTTKIIAGGLALTGTLYQYIYGFAIDGIIANLVYWLFYPVFLVESLF